MNEYANIFNNIISDNNYLQYLYSQNNQIEEKLNNNLNELEKNINLLNESYYNNYYIMNNSQFIEYPEEILFKINQFQKELIFNSENMIKNTYSLYKNRITNLINSTNLYVLNNLNQNYQYILTNINSSIVIQKYYQIKKDEISSTFHEFINNMYTKNNKLEFENKFESEDLFLYFQNYSGSLHKIIDESMRFIYYLESKINETFIISFGNCNQTKNSNIADNDTYNNETFDNSTYDENNDANELICSKEKKRIDENYYSKYNYEIVKLRTGIYYTKKLVENLDSLFDYFNINDLMNENKINYYDDLLNDKNIIDLHNETNYKINILKENSDKLLEEPTQNLMSYLKNIYSYDKDYLYISQKIKDLITFKNDDYNNNITYIFDYVFNNSYILLDKFNETLFKQISLRNNYDKYNINETYFEQMYLYYYSLIDDIFQEYKLKIYSLNDNYKFHNIIKKVLENLFVNKTLYYKDIINKSSKKYNLILLEDNFDIGEYQSNFIKNELDNYIFNKKYDYLEIYENNTKYYIDKIINDINEIESKIKDKLKDINDYFISDYKVNITNYIDKNYINELSNNYSNCRNYSYFLSNKDNNELFNNIIDDINNIYGYCFNYNNNYNLKQKINYL